MTYRCKPDIRYGLSLIDYVIVIVKLLVFMVLIRSQTLCLLPSTVLISISAEHLALNLRN